MRRLCFALVVLATSLVPAATAANAAIITLGSPLTAPFKAVESNSAGTVANIELPEPGAVVASPVDGVVIGWRAALAQGGPFALRVLRPGPGPGEFTGAGTAPTVAFPQPTALAPPAVPVSLPIKAGDVIGLDVGNEVKLAVSPEMPGTLFAAWGTPLAEGGSQAPSEEPSPLELGFNAEVLPFPTATAVKPASGSFKGGAKFTVEGTNLIDVSEVTVGGKLATDITSVSETQLTAITPKSAKPGTAAIAVRTPAGTANAPKPYKYTACKVPSLRGKSLKVAKKKLKKADCKIGKVKSIAGGTKVTGQKPGAGKLQPPGAKVKLTLG